MITFPPRLLFPSLMLLAYSADPSLQVLQHTDYDGTVISGQCALSPEMEILKCTLGHGHDALFDAILDHATSNP